MSTLQLFQELYFLSTVFIVHVVKSKHFLVEFFNLILLDIFILLSRENSTDFVKMFNLRDVINESLIVDDLVWLVEVVRVEGKEKVPGNEYLVCEGGWIELEGLQHGLEETISHQLFGQQTRCHQLVY